MPVYSISLETIGVICALALNLWQIANFRIALERRLTKIEMKMGIEEDKE